MDFVPPAWAAWRGGLPSTPFTLGIEEEVMLLDAHDWSLAYAADEVVAELPPDLRERVSLETHAAVIELATGVHTRVADAVAELASLRARLSAALTPRGLRAAAAGTHPMAVWSDSVVSSHPRYRAIEESTRVLARREPTLAMHVHVGVPTPHAAIQVLNRIRVHLPLLLALSANSPYWQGRATGFASTRPSVFGAFPRSGLPRRFRSYRDWTETVDLMMRSGAIPDSSYLWWDVRLQPRFGTVEIRIMDAQTRIEDVGAIAALVQALVRTELSTPLASPWHTEASEIIQENRFLAARDGMDALLITPESGGRVPAVDLLDSVLESCEPHAELLGCLSELASARTLAAQNGAARQVAFAQDGDLRRLTAELAAAFSPAESGVEKAGVGERALPA
jgi:glutamate---cysteine ligase / carboxylate-amine ligase